ncbi:MAG: L-lysine 6-transaminase [Planctomycetota bacterium]|nr:L-lysine 6-transaminase [Planctomycetota bacterium]
MITPSNVHETLSKHQLVDGFPFVVDIEKSHGAWLHDAKTGEDYLDTFMSFASWPVGYNHPMMHEPEFVSELTRAASCNIANADLYTVEMAKFVDAFGTKVSPPEYTHHFWIAGGSLAVENAMKTAFDWKARKLGRTDFADDVNDLVILHFKQAFHGRSGYTMSVTNTVPDKIGLFPKFDWPRVHNPAIVFDNEGNVANDIEAEEAKAIADIEAAYAKHGNKIAGILIETMQGEGGDNHFRGEFFAKLRQFADERESLLIFDEIQTGFYGTGKTWMWQHFDVKPDVVSFGKKSQICGIYANSRVDEVADNVFVKSSRINSTWGGNLVDMVRSRRFIEIIEAEDLCGNIATMGERAISGLRSIAKDSGAFSNVRGRGSLIAFSFDSVEPRNAMIKAMMDKKALVLPCGDTSVRFRLPLIVGEKEVDELLSRVEACVPAVSSA